MATLPTVINAAGLQPQSPAALLAQLLLLVQASNPGYTANLPGSLIEDISSTDVGAITLCDQARVDLVNSLTPYGANDFLLIQLGNVYGVPQGVNTNTSVSVVFTGTPGFVIGQGFTVSDGGHQYIVQDGVIVGTSGQTGSVFCVATVAGTWAVPDGTVTQLVTSVPSDVTLTVSNPTDGTPSAGAQTPEDYRAQVLEAGIAVSQGMPSALRTALGLVPGVQKRLISVRQQTNQWEILVGGGDPYQVANAIFLGLFDISDLTGSTLSVTGITKANPGVVSTNLTHGYTTGQVVEMTGIVGMTGLNNIPLMIAVISPNSFSVGIDTTSFPTYVSGGVVTPNLRNISVSINDYPDTYVVPIVVPLQQVVGIEVLWNTVSSNFVSPAAVAQYAAPALMDYVNSLNTGVPLNLLEMQQTFQDAITPIISSQLLTRLVFSITIDGVSALPEPETEIIPGDPESYFFTQLANISISQG